MSTRVLPDFSLIPSESLKAAIELVDRFQNGGQMIAGGTDLLVAMKSGSANPDTLIQIGALEELNFVEYNDDTGLKIGPLTTIRDVEIIPIFGKVFRLFVEAANGFANTQLLNMASIGGNICNASPAGDMLPPLLCMNANIDLQSTAGKRNVKLINFFIGPGKTVMKKNEILVSINAPALPLSYGSNFVRIRRTEEDLVKVSASVVLNVVDGKFNDVRVALGAVAPTPIRVSDVEDYLDGRIVDDATIEKAGLIARDAIVPISDLRSTATYRKQVTAYAVESAIRSSIERSISQ
ncbi:xanthine dehydrogenase family protein subunit M [Rhodobacteraceae bacterium Araon29]